MTLCFTSLQICQSNASLDQRVVILYTPPRLLAYLRSAALLASAGVSAVLRFFSAFSEILLMVVGPCSRRRAVRMTAPVAARFLYSRRLSSGVRLVLDVFFLTPQRWPFTPWCSRASPATTNVIRTPPCRPCTRCRRP